MVKKNACVFISGAGSNLKSLINYSRSYNFPINIKLVISNKKNASGLIYAKKFNIPSLLINTKDKFSEFKALNELRKKKITLICLAGYMKILSDSFIKSYNGKIINIHPSLLPKFKGTNTFKKILKNKEKVTGCTVHFVNEKLDSGKIIIKKKFDLTENENEITLKQKTQKLEYRAFSEAINKLYMMS